MIFKDKLEYIIDYDRNELIPTLNSEYYYPDNLILTIYNLSKITDIIISERNNSSYKTICIVFSDNHSVMLYAEYDDICQLQTQILINKKSNLYVNTSPSFHKRFLTDEEKKSKDLKHKEKMKLGYIELFFTLFIFSPLLILIMVSAIRLLNLGNEVFK